MKKILLASVGLTVIVLAVFFAFWMPRAAQGRQLVIYTWNKIFSPELIKAFEQENPGLKVIYKTFEENEEMLDELVRVDGGVYDLILADDYIVEFVTHADWGLAQKLDKSKISNIGNVDSFFNHQFYDPDDEYTIPLGAGIQTIVYDPLKVPLDIKGYADLWDTSLRDSVGLTANYRVINGMALKVLGKSYNTDVIADIQAAGERLTALEPNVHIIRDTGLEYDLIAGRITAAVMYTDQVTRAMLTNPNFREVFPYEGIGFGIMPAFIPVKAPNPDAAHRFLDFILDPERGARYFEHLGYYCTFEASKSFIDPAMRDYLILPGFKTFEMIENVSQEVEDEHAQVWHDFRVAVTGR